MDQPHLGHKLPRPGYSRLGLYLPCHLNGPSNRYGISPLFCSFLSILLTLRLSWCPACFGNLLTSRHVLQDCVAVEEVRVREGIRTFLNDCKIAGRSSATAYRLYVTGEDAFGSKIATEEHLQRGGCLSRLTDEWLDLWESVTEWLLQNIVGRINCSKVELALLLLCGGFSPLTSLYSRPKLHNGTVDYGNPLLLLHRSPSFQGLFCFCFSPSFPKVTYNCS